MNVKGWILTLFLGAKHNITMLCLALFVGAFGYIVGGTMGFVSMFLFSILTGYLILLCLIPFVGLFLYWYVANYFADWIAVTVGFDTGVVRLIPMVLYAIVGAVLWIAMSVIGFIVILAILGALVSRR